MGIKRVANISVNRTDNWFSKNAPGIGRTVEVLFGLIWGVDVVLKLNSQFISNFPQLIMGASNGQPQWLSGWFSFWSSATSVNPMFFAYMIIALEAALCISLVFGFARKLAYGGGFLLSFLIWSVPEGFGGPYGPTSTDIGAGIIYAMIFLFLAVINATYGPDSHTLDSVLEKRVGWWKSVSEIKH